MSCEDVDTVSQPGQAKQPSQETWWAGLHKEWDQVPVVRARLRAGLRLLTPHELCMSTTVGQETFVEHSIHNVRQNKVVLIPAMRRWGMHDPEAVPQVDFLFHEVEELLKQSYDHGEVPPRLLIPMSYVLYSGS